MGSLEVQKMLFASADWLGLMSLLLSRHDLSANFHWWCCPVGWVQASLPPWRLFTSFLSAWA